MEESKKGGAAHAPCRRGLSWFADLFGFLETDGATVRHLLHEEAGPLGTTRLVSSANGASVGAGCFSTPSLAELRREAHLAAKDRPGRLTVDFVYGDVSKLHAQRENRLSLFQAASQFNCLEFVGPSVTPEDGVTAYTSDRTQGPACSVACGGGTVFRNWFVRVGSQVGQTRERQIENLADVLSALSGAPDAEGARGGEDDEKYMKTTGGYTMASNSGLDDLNAKLEIVEKEGGEAALDDLRSRLRIGVHRDLQVTSWDWGRRMVESAGDTAAKFASTSLVTGGAGGAGGSAPAEQIVSQAFCSACSVSYSGNPRSKWKRFASLVLEASYEATLLAAILNACRHGGAEGSRKVYLTLLGGGVFGNSLEWIASAIRRSCELLKDTDLEVKLVMFRPSLDDSRFNSLVSDFSPRSGVKGT